MKPLSWPQAARASIAIVGCWTVADSAYAGLTVNPGLSVRNDCGQEIAIAVHYKAGTGWATTSFVNIPARGTKERVASSTNSVFYYYAESLSGKHKWAGDKNFKVDGKVYGMKKKELTLDEQRNRFLLTLSCAAG
jgi:uncharacterized membrane protein